MTKDPVLRAADPIFVPASAESPPALAEPPTVPPDAAAPGGGPMVVRPAASGAAGEFLIRLNRVVQRATIYPSGHPSVRASLRPFLDAAQALFALVDTVTLLIGRDRITLSCGGQDLSSESIGWLASRLSERGIAAIRFDRVLDEERSLALVVWLAAPTSEEASGPAASIDGVELKRADYSALRFVEGSGERAPLGDHDVAWRRMVAGLSAGGVWGHAVPASDVERFDAPEVLAAQIETYLAAHEGTGSSGLIGPIVAAGESAGALSEAARHELNARMARFLALLPTSLKSQLLRVSPGMSESRLRFLESVLEHVPAPMLLEVMGSMRLAPGQGSMPLVSFLTRLGVLAGERGPESADLYAHVLTRAGVSPDVMQQGRDVLRAALETMLLVPLDDQSVPSDYRGQLEHLSDAGPDAPVDFDATRWVRPDDADAAISHVALIAAHIVLADPSATDNPAVLGRALTALPSALARNDFECLATVADAARLVSDASGGSSTAGAAVAGVNAFMAHADTVGQVLAALGEASPALAAHLGTIVRAGGLAAAEALLAKITETPSATDREPLVALLTTVDVSVLKQLLSAARAQLRVHPKVLVAVLCHHHVSVAHELAEPFISDADGDVRLQAYRVVLNASPNLTKLERLVRSALEDPDPRIVELAVVELRSKAPAYSARPLGQLLSHATTPTLERAQRLAVQALLDAGAPLGRDHLVAALAQRGRAYEASSRRVSGLIRRALHRIGGDTAVRAARRWRRSPAGLLSLVLRDRVE